MSNPFPRLSRGSLSTSSNKTTSQDPCYRPDTQRNQEDFIRSKGPSRRIVITKYSYMFSFQIGDKMEVLDDSDDDWWKVRHSTTKTIGYVPANFLADESVVQSKDWFMENVSRKEAEKLLMNSDNPRGTFLVRPSERTPGNYSLSVKDQDKQIGYHVKHYKIQPLDNGGFYISRSKYYHSLSALVEAYSENAFGLCHVLSKPCPKPQPQVWDLTSTFEDKWEIPRDEIVLGPVLGTGNFGEVYLGRWKDTKDVAVKTIKRGSMSIHAFLEEVAIMKECRHDCLVALYGVCSVGQPIYIVQEYMEKGSLLNLLRKGKGKVLHVDDLIYIAAQVASGMKYLESKQQIHGDLAARNVLMGKNFIAKISDFGLARIVDNSQYLLAHKSILPIRWTAPESFNEVIFSIKSDVWSYGILLMELFTYGTTPYANMTSEQVQISVANGYRMPKPDTVMDAIYTKTLECCNANPDERPTFENLKDYFEDFGVNTER